VNDALVRPTTLVAFRQALSERGLTVEVREPLDEDIVIHGVEQHSARVDNGDIFLAWQGTSFDAHDRVAEAEASGAVAALVERFVPGVTIPQLRVENGRVGAAVASDVLYGSPWRGMNVTAITGTNGKTTTAQLLRWVLGGAGAAVASIGTLGLVEADGSVRDGTESLTTPGPVTLSRWMAELRAAGVTTLVMEASSHALDQHRLDGILVDAAVFTNLTQDHLDYHGDFDSYASAKRRLAGLSKPGGVVVRWEDDPAWKGLEGPGQTISYSAARPADLRALNVEASMSGTAFEMHFGGEQSRVELPLVGAFNVENALAASGVALAQGISVNDVAKRLSTAPQIAGRLERALDLPFQVLIDYAHTPDALDRVLTTLRPLTDGRLIVVFGAGGDRDRTKRPQMAEAAARGADYVIVTSDNPRTEDPERIIDDIMPGLGTADHARLVSRKDAVRHALTIAREGDVVLLAGKGHERYQVIGTEVVHLDERELVQEWLEAAS
jgi:UDP-N-acetylmuramoyl-L-alanyl-D-glutamate--2,6-diaminopimelate ligase